ncbi:hypothetical protein QFC22_005607 [Naganishia vaughanmartiniae]|uniref:Uncharacterized protein n=1 Tax=Naganishia vaughanmartiniae TaxID=1424756 RepID=A0ACC2WV87_9TREE|nr:hypothetical protein QFC22_005607 [Naganishia vaughanmartiniae]
MVPPQVAHDDQTAIIYGSGRAGSLFSAAKTEETIDSQIGNDDDEQASVTTHVAEPQLPPPPRVSTPEQRVILVHESIRDAWDFMALSDESFSPDDCNQKLLRKWLLHLHNDILDSVKNLNDRRLPLRYPGPSDPVKEARDSLIHVEKLLSTGIIYRLPTRGKKDSAKFTDRCNFLYHLLWRQPQLLKDILYSAYVLTRAMSEYRVSTPEGKPIYKTDGTLRTVINLAEKVTRVRKRIDLEREQQLLVLCESLVVSAKDHGLVLRPSSACAIRCSLEQAKVVSGFKTDHMFGFLDSYHLRMAKSPDTSSDKVFDINQCLQADVEVHVGIDIKLTPR